MKGWKPSGGAMTDVVWGMAGLMDAIGGWATALLATLDQRFGLLAPIVIRVELRLM
jgi:hypothetical protein